MRHLDLFSGIGGFALATEMVWNNVEHIFCDNDLFCQAVLHKHWPTAVIHGDIKKLTGGGMGTIDLITGGFPCQPFSNAGKRKGTEDDRHLWPEMLRVIREVRPRWIIGENVAGILTWNGGMVIEQIYFDLEASGYKVASPIVIPACAVDAPHRRDRIWIVAHSDSIGLVHGESQKQSTKSGQQTLSEFISGSENVADAISNRRTRGSKQKLEASTQKRGASSVDAAGCSGNVSDSDCIHVQRGDVETEKERPQSNERPTRLSNNGRSGVEQWAVEPAVGRVAHGVSNRVDRIKSLGNAIVPQVAAQIMRIIKQIDNDQPAFLSVGRGVIHD